MIVTRELVARIEASLADSARHYARVKAQIDPEGGAGLLDVAGGAIVAGGRDSGPNVGRGWGMGIAAPIDEAALDSIERFETSRARAPSMVLCPFVDDESLGRVARRGYQIVRYDAVLAASVDAVAPTAPRPALVVERADESALAEWWSVYEDAIGGPARDAEGVRRLNAPFFVAPSFAFVGREHGKAVAAGAVVVTGDVGHLLAAAVKTSARGRGIQRDLTAARVQWAASRGASLVVATCAHGGASFANLQRAGLQVVYTSTVLQRARAE